MSVTGDAIDIPTHVLNIAQTCPGAVGLYYASIAVKTQSPVGSIRKLPHAISILLREVYSETPHEIGKTLSLEICQSIFHFQQSRPDEFALARPNIPDIVRMGKSASCVNFGRYWQLVDFLFCGTVNPNSDVLTIDNSSSLGVNLLSYRKHPLNPSIHIQQSHSWYLEPQEVQTVASFLRDCGNEIVEEHFNRIQQVHSSLYWIERHPVSIWDDDAWRSLAREMCNELINLYVRAAERDRAVLIRIG